MKHNELICHILGPEFHEGLLQSVKPEDPLNSIVMPWQPLSVSVSFALADFNYILRKCKNLVSFFTIIRFKAAFILLLNLQTSDWNCGK